MDVIVIQISDDSALVQLADKSQANKPIAVITSTLSLALKGMNIRDRSAVVRDLSESESDSDSEIDITAAQVSPE